MKKLLVLCLALPSVLLAQDVKTYTHGIIYSGTTVAKAYALRLTVYQGGTPYIVLQNTSTNRCDVFLGTTTNGWAAGKTGISLAPLGTQGDRVVIERPQSINIIGANVESNQVGYTIGTN